VKKVIYLLICAFIGILSINLSVSAHEFTNPPEIYAPSWWTDFPYQRNIYWDFDYESAPEIPETGLLPEDGSPVYEGYDDGELLESDYVWIDPDGPVKWYPTVPGFSRYGLLGIDNRQGTEILEGDIVIHLDNHERDWPFKHVWKEIVYYEHDLTEPISYLRETMGLDNGYTFDCREPIIQVLTDGFERHNVWYEIQPNPYWEDIKFHFYADPGQLVVIDTLHIATECVIPEPGTMILLGSLAIGLFGMAGLRRRVTNR